MTYWRCTHRPVTRPPWTTPPTLSRAAAGLGDVPPLVEAAAAADAPPHEWLTEKLRIGKAGAGYVIVLEQVASAVYDAAHEAGLDEDDASAVAAAALAAGGYPELLNVVRGAALDLQFPELAWAWEAAA